MDEYEDEELDSLLDLGGDEFDGLVVDVPMGISFPCIYSPMHPQYGGGAPRYGGRIPLSCLPPELHHQVPHKTQHFEEAPGVFLGGPTKPEVVPMTRLLRAIEAGEVRHDEQDARRGAENKLVELVQRLGARNLSTDRLFVERHVQVELRGLRMGHELMGLAWRHAPDHVVQGYEGKFKLIPTRVWVDLREDE